MRVRVWSLIHHSCHMTSSHMTLDIKNISSKFSVAPAPIVSSRTPSSKILSVYHHLLKFDPYATPSPPSKGWGVKISKKSKKGFIISDSKNTWVPNDIDLQVSFKKFTTFATPITTLQGGRIEYPKKHDWIHEQRPRKPPHTKFWVPDMRQWLCLCQRKKSRGR